MSNNTVTEDTRRRTRMGLAIIMLGLLLAAETRSAHAVTYEDTPLYSFCTQTNCADGSNPFAGVISDAKGNLYGTTSGGGVYGHGVVFKVNPVGKETVLYSFTGGADGADPYAGVISDGKGNLYGTTFLGGPSGAGVVFTVSPEGKETVIYSFCRQANCADGKQPPSGVISDGNGNLYGTTWGGGASNEGVVFKVSPKGEETVLYSFTGGADGANPYAGVISDGQGNLYGTTFLGGPSGAGVVFTVSPEGKETVVCSFTGGADGANPYAGVISDAKGNLYGTTSGGGASSSGVVFEVSPKGEETVLYSFCTQTNCADGAHPQAGGLIFDAKGNLYGTTAGGGAWSSGVVFEVSPKGQETVLYSFTDGIDGAGPLGGVIFDAKGNFYGTTSGSYSGYGVVFKLTACVAQDSAQLSTIYSLIGPCGDSYDGDRAVAVAGPDSDVGQQWFAEPFTPKNNAEVTRIRVAILNDDGTNSVTISLNEDASGLPGNALRTWNLKNLPQGLGCCELERINVKNPIPVKQGTQYWLVASTNANTTDTYDRWMTVYNDATAPLVAVNVGNGWEAVTDSYLLHAFGIFGVKK